MFTMKQDFAEIAAEGVLEYSSCPSQASTATERSTHQVSLGSQNQTQDAATPWCRQKSSFGMETVSIDGTHSQTSMSPISFPQSRDGLVFRKYAYLDDRIVDSIISKYFEVQEELPVPTCPGVYLSSDDLSDWKHHGQQTNSPLPPEKPPRCEFNLLHSNSFSASSTIFSEPPKIDSQEERHAKQSTSSRKREGLLLEKEGKATKSKRPRARARKWTADEHKRFEESLRLFGRNWHLCAAYVGTRRPQHVRSHAQKHLIKLWKLGLPLPKKIAESGSGYTLSGKPLLPDSASARSYLIKIPCPPSLQDTHSADPCLKGGHIHIQGNVGQTQFAN